MGMLPALLMLSFASPHYIVYVGTYTGPKSKGIYAWRFDSASGALAPLGLAAATPSPSFLAIHPNHKFLYAVNEVRGGAVTAFAIDPKSEKLTELNSQSTRGGGPCFVAVDRTGKDVMAANYGSGSIAVFPVKDDGSLGEASAFVQHKGSSADPARQRGPHAHYIDVSPDNRFVLAVDLGLDQVLVYRFDPAKGTLQANQPPLAKVAPGAGPRHLAFTPSGKFAYVMNEMKPSVTAFAWNATAGTLRELQTVSSLPENYTVTEKDSGAEIRVHPNGRFVYASNRGHDSIAVFAIGADGRLKAVEHVPTQGKTPRNFTLDPEGKWLFAANQDSDDVVLFRVDAETGRLTPAGKTIQVGAPVSVEFLPLP